MKRKFELLITTTVLTFFLVACNPNAQKEKSSVLYSVNISNPGLENNGEGWHIWGYDWSEDLWSDDAYDGTTSANIATNNKRQRCVLMSPAVDSLDPGMTVNISFYAKWISGDNTVFVDFHTMDVLGPSPGQWQGEIPTDGSWHQVEVEIEVPYYVKEKNISIRIGLPHPMQSNWKKPKGDFEASNYLIDNISVAALDKEIKKLKQPRDTISHSFDANDIRDNDSKFGVYWTPWRTYSKNPINSPEDLNRSKEEIQQQLDLMQEAGIKWVRSIWRWDKIEWTKGKPDYAFLDYVVEEAWKRDIRILPGLFHSPRWTSTAPADYADYSTYPPDMNDWENFVSNLVDHFKSKIKYWEIWNEPNQWYSFYWQGTQEDFFELQKVAFNAAKSADPTCKVLMGSFWNSGFGHLYQLLDMGIKDYFDIVAIHPYSDGKLNIDRAIYADKALRMVLAQYECEDKPIWFTEIGWLERTITGAQRSEMLNLLYTYPFHAAVEKIFWFEFNGLVRMKDGNIIKTPSYEAYRKVTSGE